VPAQDENIEIGYRRAAGQDGRRTICLLSKANTALSYMRHDQTLKADLELFC